MMEADTVHASFAKRGAKKKKRGKRKVKKGFTWSGVMTGYAFVLARGRHTASEWRGVSDLNAKMP